MGKMKKQMIYSSTEEQIERNTAEWICDDRGFYETAKLILEMTDEEFEKYITERKLSKK